MSTVAAKKQWVEKVRERIDLIILSNADQQPFYGVAAPDGIVEEYFEMSAAVMELLNDLGELRDFGDVLPPNKILELNECYRKFDEKLKISENHSRVVGLRLELGRAKAKIKKLEKGND